MSLKILVLGVNGFIGSHLLEQGLKKTDWYFSGLDLEYYRITKLLRHARFRFKQGDMTQEFSWIEKQIAASDVILPLVAIATPASYVQDPLRIFELDFEANVRVIRLCVKHKKRVVFPSTSEVYGMCPDLEFDEETSPLVLGPINKSRWIYSCCKQLLDRLVYSYGLQNQLRYTLFRPFNWIGPKLDDPSKPKPGSSRVVSQFIGNILRREPIQLVAGGKQRRSFIDIEDAIAALIKIIANEKNCAEQAIFNIGNPKNDISIRDLASLLVELVKSDIRYKDYAQSTPFRTVAADNYYGEGYEDIKWRRPSIQRAQRCLSWKPTVDIRTCLKTMLEYYL